MGKKTGDAATQLKAIGNALKRERQLENWLDEIRDQLDRLQRQRDHAKREMTDLKAVLDADPALTAVAREMMQTALDLRGAGDEELSVYNPNHVTADTKKQLLIKILRDYQVENPGQDAMGFAEIREVLKNRYKIETKSAGLFFRNEIQDFETRGGNKRKFIVLPKIVK